jgi:hypothetical protein
MTSSLLHQVELWGFLVGLVGLTITIVRAIISKQFRGWMMLVLVVSWLCLAGALLLNLLGRT